MEKNVMVTILYVNPSWKLGFYALDFTAMNHNARHEDTIVGGINTFYYRLIHPETSIACCYHTDGPHVYSQGGHSI
jgi:hypothetical protein